MNQHLVPIRIAAKRTDMTVECIRAWERRYQAIKPQRGRGGRLFTENDIQRLLLLKKAVDEGQSISQVANLSDFELNQLNNPSEAWVDNQNGSIDFQNHLEQVLKHLQNYDAHGADQVLGKLAAFLNPRQFCYEVMLPLMARVGEAWVEGTINVAQEHMASHVMRSLVANHLRLHHVKNPTTQIIIASPQGELHEFGMLCASILAIASGIQALYLGPNLPCKDMIHAAQTLGASALVMGFTPQKMFGQPSLQQLLQLREALTDTCRILVGGGMYDALAYQQMKDLGIQYPANFEELEHEFRILAYS